MLFSDTPEEQDLCVSALSLLAPGCREGAEGLFVGRMGVPRPAHSAVGEGEAERAKTWGNL